MREVSTDTGWRTAVVRQVSHATDRVTVLRLEVAGWPRHAPGQHCVVRLTAEDGYTATRSYSVASSPNDDLLELAVERLEDGEVSGYLTDVARPGDEFEVRGPIGGWFVWDATSPAVAVGGGTGVVPFVSMLRYAAEVGRADLLTLAVSAKTMTDLPYADELTAAGALVALTRESFGPRAAGRLTAAEVLPLVRAGATYFICGSPVFAEGATQLLLAAGVAAPSIRVERFGPSS